MYLAIAIALFGESFLFGNLWVLSYAAGAWLVTHLFVVFYEEPHLRRQFPDDYTNFRAHVPRWIPRFSPWRGAETQNTRGSEVG